MEKKKEDARAHPLLDGAEEMETMRHGVWGMIDWKRQGLSPKSCHTSPGLPRQGRGRLPDVTIKSVMQ